MSAYGDYKIPKNHWNMSDAPKINVLCFIAKVYGPFFFAENTVAEVTYLAMLQNWFLPQISEDSVDLIFQQDEAPPHWHRDVGRFLNESRPQR